MQHTAIFILHPRAPAPPQHERCAKRDGLGRGADPERRPPTRGARARGLAGRDVARGDEGVEVGEDGRADEGGVGDDAKVAAEVREAPDGGEDAGAANEETMNRGEARISMGKRHSQNRERRPVRDACPDTAKWRVVSTRARAE